jgi:hypothetical protein
VSSVSVSGRSRSRDAKPITAGIRPRPPGGDRCREIHVIGEAGEDGRECIRDPERGATLEVRSECIGCVASVTVGIPEPRPG